MPVARLRVHPILNGSERLMRAMTLRLPDEVHEALHGVAYQRRTSMQKIVEEAIERYLASMEEGE